MTCKRVHRMLAAMLLLLTSSPAWADLFVIVNADNPVKVMTEDQIERIFLMKAKRFANGDAAEPVNQAENTPVRDHFNAQVLQRNEQQLKYYWSRKMFSGGDKPPPVIGGNAEVENYVAANKGGIGYLDKAPKNPGVKVVLRLKL